MIKEAAYRERGRDLLTGLRHTGGDTLEILQVISGEGNIMIRDRLFPIRAGGVYFINAREPHCSMPRKAKDYVRSKAVISEEAFRQLLFAIGDGNAYERLFGLEAAGVFFPVEGEAERIDALFEELCREWKRGAAMASAAALLSICKAATEASEPCAPVHDGCVARVLEYINMNISGEITLDGIYEKLYMSKAHLARQFKRSTGMTIMEYVRMRRLSIAKRLLVGSGETVSRIAERSGFGSFAYFSKLFKEVEGVTPSEYRRGLRGKEQILKMASEEKGEKTSF